MTLRRSGGIGRTVLALCLGFAGAGLGAGAQADAWRDGRPMEGARTQVRAAAVAGEIYVAGGSSIMGPRAEFEVYDPVADHWRAMPAMPKGRELFGLAALGSVIYVAGGIIDTDVPASTAEVWAFDTRSSQWSRSQSLPETRTGLALAVADAKLFALGGRGEGAEQVLRFDPTTNEWSAFGAALSPARTGHAVAVDGTRIFVIGGQAPDGTLLSRVDIFDAATGTVSAGPALPRAAMSQAADFVGGTLHVAGGMVPAERRTLADHYALESGVWKTLAPLPTPRQGLSSAAVGNEWFVIGGGSGSGAYTVFTASDAVEVWRP